MTSSDASGLTEFGSVYEACGRSLVETRRPLVATAAFHLPTSCSSSSKRTWHSVSVRGEEAARHRLERSAQAMHDTGACAWSM